MSSRHYIAIDLKSFFASAECVARGLNPLDACLVVADRSRTDKTICLAVSPALKAFGLPGRPRLFEVVRKVREVNRMRGRAGSSISAAELSRRPDLAVDYVVAPPRMALYVDCSERIYSIYLRYVAPEDIHRYSVDEVFIDATPYLRTYRMTARQLAETMMRDVLRETGITATAGIGSNLYLCKVAMDIVAKKMTPDSHGMRIAELDEHTYRQTLWTHAPLTDFWSVGHGTVRRLAAGGIFTMGDVARRSLADPEWLYRQFGVNAELLIDHAWGHEPVTMAQIKAYRPTSRSLSRGQVLSEPYSCAKARIVVLEMADSLSLTLIDRKLVTDKITLTIGYDVTALSDPAVTAGYSGRIATDRYGRSVPYPAHGTASLPRPTSAESIISREVAALFDRIADPQLPVRRITIGAQRVTPESEVTPPAEPLQLELFTDYDELHRRQADEQARLDRERRRREAVLSIKKRFGKNAILRGLNYADGATQRTRNKLIGGHNA